MHLALITLLFFEGFCMSVSPYMETIRKPWYAFIHDRAHFWFFDPYVRIPNGYFNLNQARSEKHTYDKGSKKRIALFGSSAAYGQFFPEPSSKIFPAQLENKLRQHGYRYDVLNFAFPASTSFSGMIFFKGIYQLFKPDIVLWSYARNDQIFMKGTMEKYRHLESMYTQKKFFLQRMLRLSYAYSSLINLIHLAGVEVILYLPRSRLKQQQYQSNLEALQAFCKKNNIKFVLLEETADETLWFYYNAKREKIFEAHYAWFNDVLLPFSKKYNVPYLFCTPILFQHRDDRLYLDTVHYSKAGHDVMADILFEFLTKNKLVR